MTESTERKTNDEPSWIELQRILPLEEVRRLCGGISIDTIRRHHADKVIQISPRRIGMRMKDALMLSGT